MREIENHHWNSIVVITVGKVINECYNEGPKLQGEREHFHSLRISPTKYCCCGFNVRLQIFYNSSAGTWDSLPLG